MAIVKHATLMHIFLKAQSQHLIIGKPSDVRGKGTIRIILLFSRGGCDDIRRQYCGTPVLYPDVRQLSGHLDR